MGTQVKEYVLPDNYRLLKKNHPALLAELENLNTFPAGQVVPGPTGALNLKLDLDGKTIFLHPEKDPESDKNYFLPNIPINFSGVEILFGMGLGYGATAVLQQRKDIRNLVIIESEPGILLQALAHMDLADLLNDHRVIVGIAPEDPPVFMASAQKGIAFEDTQILEHPIIFKQFHTTYKPVQDRIFAHVNQYNIAGATKMKFGKKIVSNRFEHLKSMGHYFRFEDLMDQFTDIPAYIVAGGPSLEADIGFLEKIRDKALVLAVDTVLPVFLNHGMVPDFVSCIDHQDLTFEKIAQKIGKVPETVSLLTYTATTPVVQKNFPGHRKFFLMAEDGISNWVNTLVAGSRSFASGPSVANLNFIAAKVMGCSPIIMLGQDLCYHLERSHTKDVVLTSHDRVKKLIETGKELSWVKTVDGKDAPTDRGMINIKNFFESLIRHNPGEYINCSRGGAHIEGTQYMPLSQAMDLYCSARTSVSEKMEKICQPENTITPELILKNIKKDLQVVEQILSLSRKVEGLLQQCRHEVPGIRKKWKRNPSLPQKTLKRLSDIDALNNRIDGYHRVWQILEDMTAKSLQKSEQMAFEAGKLQGVPQKYPEWLDKTVERLVYVTDIRTDALEFLQQGIEDVMAHITEEIRLKKTDTNHYETRENLIALYMASQDYSLARPLVEKFYDLNPESAQANYYMGVLSGHQRLLDQMDDFFIAAERIDPGYGKKIDEFRSDFGDYHFALAVPYKENNTKVGKKFLLLGLRFCPFHEQLQNLLKKFAEQDVKTLHAADAKNEIQKHAETVEDWIELMNTYSMVHSCIPGGCMGILYYFGGKIDFLADRKENAAVLFKKSMIYLPRDAGLYLNVADLYLCAFDYDQGILYLNKAIELDSGCATYWEGFGDFLFQKKKFDEAVSAFEQALQYFPQNMVIQEKMVQCYLQKGNMLHHNTMYNEAEKIYNQGIQICQSNSPSLVHLYNNLGSALQNMKRFDLALTAYEKALEIDSNYVEALCNKGELFQSIGNIEAALAAYQDAIRKRPDAALVYQKTGALLQAAGDLKAAEKMFQKARLMTE